MHRGLCVEAGSWSCLVVAAVLLAASSACSGPGGEAGEEGGGSLPSGYEPTELDRWCGEGLLGFERVVGESMERTCHLPSGVRHGKLQRASQATGEVVLEGGFDHGVAHGAYRTADTQGHTLARGSYDRGRKDGLWEDLLVDGTVARETRYHLGRPCGTWKRLEEGALVLWLAIAACEEGPELPEIGVGSAGESRPERGERPPAEPQDGTFTTLHGNGEVAGEQSWADGQPEGTWRRWWSGGIQRGEETWVVGLRDGTSHGWSDTGVLREQVAYDAGLTHGLRATFRASGLAEQAGAWRDGYESGRWARYLDDGTLMIEWTNDAFEAVGQTRAWYYGDEPAYEDGTTLWGEPHGRFVGWLADGSVQLTESTYEHGLLQGDARVWHLNGQLAAEGPYHQGFRERTWRYWYDNGEPEAEGGWWQSLKHGAWQYWYRDGSPQAEGSYEYGQRHGAWTDWDEAGNATESTWRAGEQEETP